MTNAADRSSSYRNGVIFISSTPLRALMRLSLLSMLLGFSAAFKLVFPPSQSRRISAPVAHSTSTSTTRLNYASAATTATADNKYLLPPNPAFEDRMRNLGLSDNNKKVQQAKKKKNKLVRVQKKRQLPSNMRVSANGLDEYRRLVFEETTKMTVVRFYAPWCRSCKRIEPMFEKLAKQNPNVNFVQVPVSNQHKNKNLIDLLGVTRIPYAHIYHPQRGLVEELPMNRKNFDEFRLTFFSYVDRICQLPQDVDSTTGVYEYPYSKYTTVTASNN